MQCYLSWQSQFTHISTSLYFLPLAKKRISRVIFSSSLRLCTDSVKICNVGRALCFPLIMNDWTMKFPITLFDEPSFECIIVVSELGLMISVTIPAKIMVLKYGLVLFIVVGAGSVLYSTSFPFSNIFHFLSSCLPNKVFATDIMATWACASEICNSLFNLWLNL